MELINKINRLRLKYAEDSCVRGNATLYGLEEPDVLNAKHFVFTRMPQKVMDYMVNSYLLQFPEDLLVLYRYMNGACLFWTTCQVGRSNMQIQISQFDIFGIPLTNDADSCEPYNISVEDLVRPEGVPDSWLKFAAFYYPDNLHRTIMLFVDTDTLQVFAVDGSEKKCTVIDEWSSIDESLCEVFDLFCE